MHWPWRLGRCIMKISNRQMQWLCNLFGKHELCHWTFVISCVATLFRLSSLTCHISSARWMSLIVSICVFKFTDGCLFYQNCCLLYWMWQLCCHNCEHSIQVNQASFPHHWDKTRCLKSRCLSSCEAAENKTSRLSHWDTGCVALLALVFAPKAVLTESSSQILSIICDISSRPVWHSL